MLLFDKGGGDGGGGFMMDTAEFAGWLSAMARLNGEQIALALADLGELARRSGEIEGQSSAEGRPETEPSIGAGGGREASRIERDVLSAIGEGKGERFGCADGGADEVIGWGR